MEEFEQLPTTFDESLEDTIELMESSQLCVHPVHHHSFAQVTFLISGSMRLCTGCDKRLHSVLGFVSDSQHQVVRCMACGVYAHRTCAMSHSTTVVWKEKCKVNTKRMQQDEEETSEDDGHKKDEEKTEREAPQKMSEKQDGQRPPADMFSTAKETSQRCKPPLTMEEMKTSVTMVWTNDGPPTHWADKEGAIAELVDESKPEVKEEIQDNDQPMEISESTFSNVARTIQENVFIHFRRRDRSESYSNDDENDEEDDDDSTLPEARPLLEDEDSEEPCYPRKEETLDEKKERLGLVPSSEASLMTKETQKALLEELKPEALPPKRSSLLKLASGTYEAAKTSSKLRKKLGVASVVGGIAGGVAGLVFAGPAGFIFGAKAGQTAGLLSVVIEGSVAVGVLVAGAAAGSFTATQIQQQAEQRILAIGEEGSKRKVLLVRPNVWIDPAWETICENAKRGSPSVQPQGMLSILSNSPAKQAEIAQKERYQRDSDIVQTAEFELPTEQKVLLLVSRILTDKLSPPGHVYRELIKEHRKRSTERKLEEISDVIDAMEAEALKLGEEIDKDKLAAAPTIRSRRLDAHAVIKHVTATLLEVRPGFAANPTITEMSATAVEGLVFGELYNSIFEEILEETRDVDEALMDKITTFKNEHTDLDNEDISQKALCTLTLISEAHSPVDKLRYCVAFLERVSDHFSYSNQKALSADSLLKMVCLHLIVANVPHMNAEVGFLEEFARDERLLRGKEGYALVTLQASLHFLNASCDFENDIFLVDDE